MTFDHVMPLMLVSAPVLGGGLVVMDKKDYVQKAEKLLGQQETCKPILAVLITRQKNRLLNLLRNIKAEGSIKEPTYKKIFPTEAGSPKFYGLPKIHKIGAFPETHGFQ